MNKDVAILYGVKALRVLLIWLGATVAARLFETEYIEKVYGKDQNPPHLTGMVLIIGVALLLFNVLISAGMIVFSSDFQEDSSDTFSFSKSYIKVVGIDTLIHTGVVIVIGFILASTIQSKKYIGYRKEGIRAIRAFKEMLLAVSIPFVIVPYFFSKT